MVSEDVFTYLTMLTARTMYYEEVLQELQSSSSLLPRLNALKKDEKTGKTTVLRYHKLSDDAKTYYEDIARKLLDIHRVTVEPPIPVVETTEELELPAIELEDDDFDSKLPLSFFEKKTERFEQNGDVSMQKTVVLDENKAVC